jgi:hypothetical protein
MRRTFRVCRIFSQWRSRPGNWCFVPFSVWVTDEFWGFVILNFCFEFARTEEAQRIHADA